MRKSKLLETIDTAAIRDAIRRAETETSGEIRVSVSPYFWGSIEKAAHRAFDRLGMRSTRHRNGILFFIVPSRQKFMVLGDEGIHARVGSEFWSTIASALSGRFQKGEFTLGLVEAITVAGSSLKAHFPAEASDTNELPDDVDLGG